MNTLGEASGNRRGAVLEPSAQAALDAAWMRSEAIGERLEEALDWIEASPPDPRSRRRRFSSGIWAISIVAAGGDWLILWEDHPDTPQVWFVGESAALG